MIILGVDPGLANTGVCILTDGKPTAWDTLKPPMAGKKYTAEEVLQYVLPKIHEWCDRFKPAAAAVETVTWYGKGRRITLPLSHVAGGIIGMLWYRGIPVFCLNANMRTVRVPMRKTCDEHQQDAAALASVVQRQADAEAANDATYLRKHSAVVRRRIIAPKHVLGELCKKG